MKKILILIFIISILGVACNRQSTENLKENYKAEIMKVEDDFAQMAAEEGIAKAFLAFADKEAVLLRGQKPIKGKEAIRAYFADQSDRFEFVKLEWKPDFIEVSESGDLAYTYGGFKSEVKTADGEITTATGTFHTVWKRQDDGSWKFVWD